MHFPIDADLPRSVGALIRSYGHNATDIRDIGMRRALDATIAQHAQREGLCLLTGDFDFSDVENACMVTAPLPTLSRLPGGIRRSLSRW